MLSAMVLEKAPESECDGMVANSAAFRGWLMVHITSTDYLARKLAPAHLEALLRVGDLKMSMVLHAQGRKGDLLLYSVLRKARYSPQAALLMLDCDRSLASPLR
jgi:hypothetical protein